MMIKFQATQLGRSHLPWCVFFDETLIARFTPCHMGQAKANNLAIRLNKTMECDDCPDFRVFGR